MFFDSLSSWHYFLTASGPRHSMANCFHSGTLAFSVLQKHLYAMQLCKLTPTHSQSPWGTTLDLGNLSLTSSWHFWTAACLSRWQETLQGKRPSPEGLQIITSLLLFLLERICWKWLFCESFTHSSICNESISSASWKAFFQHNLVWKNRFLCYKPIRNPMKSPVFAVVNPKYIYFLLSLSQMWKHIYKTRNNAETICFYKQSVFKFCCSEFILHPHPPELCHLAYCTLWHTHTHIYPLNNGAFSGNVLLLTKHFNICFALEP